MSKLTTGSLQAIRLKCTVCTPTFLRLTRKARQGKVRAASPPQLGPRGSELAESSWTVSSKCSAPGSSCRNWSAHKECGRAENIDNPRNAVRNARIRILPQCRGDLFGANFNIDHTSD